MYVGESKISDTVVNMEFRQPVRNRNELFSCIQPQIAVDRATNSYTGNHMRYHLYQYCIENRDTVEPVVAEVLRKRKISYDMYPAKMYQCLTCGFETTLLILAHMFKIPILVIRQDFVWISSKVAPIMCPVVLVQDETGFLLGTRTPNPIYVGSVPVVTVPYLIMNEGLFATSTPSCTSNRPTNTFFSCGLSPINSDNTTTDTNISVENKRRNKTSNTKSKKTKENARKSQPIMTVVRNQEMNKDGHFNNFTGDESPQGENKEIRGKDTRQSTVYNNRSE